MARAMFPLRPLAAIAFGLLLIAATPGQVPEPEGFWEGPMRGYTPNTVKGALVIDTTALAALIAEAKPVLLDVAPADQKPPAMAPGAPWLPVHRSIPGAVWLPGAGGGRSDAAFGAAFKDRIAELMDGDLDRAVVAFCHPECWGSWNAAKRLGGLGYLRVYWYPDGIEGWQEDHELAAVKPDPAWAAANPSDRTQ
jgi:PQQ-dependent catabolism-associated CXXCW motif protein